MSYLDDIARQASTSKATVSRVINDKGGVSGPTRDAVLTAMDVLGIEIPERLRPRSNGLVGLVVSQLEDPLFPLFAQVIGSDLSRRRFTPVLCAQTPESPGEDEYVAMLRDRGVAGIIFVSGLHAEPDQDHARYRVLGEAGLPVVLVNGPLPDVDVPSLSCDDAAAGRLAVGHLTELGHERIGLLTTGPRFSPNRRLGRGYRDAMGRHRAGVDTGGWETTTFDGVEGGYAGAMRLLDADVSGIVCGSDLLALGAIRAARESGRAVPGDVSVLGYGDAVVMAHTDPPLSTVRQPALPMGRRAAMLLMDEIRGHPVPRGESLFAPELVVRASTARRASDR